jgi:hypothetical protein
MDTLIFPVLIGAVIAGAPSPAAPAEVTQVATGNALSTVAQRHLVRLAPTGQPAAWLLAAQRGSGDGGDGPGLHFYRSDDEGQSWSHYAPIAQEASGASQLHLSTDLVVDGTDVAAVISYDTTNTSMPADPQDPDRKVYFQWWHHDGARDWRPGPLVTVASPADRHAYHRAELAIDSRGRLWVLAFYRGPCDTSAGVTCSDTLRLWMSADRGQTFQAQPNLDEQPVIGGGRLISLGRGLLVIWGDYSYADPALMRLRNDDDPVERWQAPVAAFDDGDSIYHGAALSAVADGQGGLHLVYKNRDQALVYRHFDGQRFGEGQPVDGADAADWALQPALTLHGRGLYVCTNHVVDPDQTNALHAWRLDGGVASEDLVLDDAADFKTYPTAPEVLPGEVPVIPCAYSANGASDVELKVALRAVPSEPLPSGRPDMPTLAPTRPDTSRPPMVSSAGMRAAGTGTPAGETVPPSSLANPTIGTLSGCTMASGPASRPPLAPIAMLLLLVLIVTARSRPHA